MLPTSRFVTVQGIRTHFYAAGQQGSPVLLLHRGGIDSGLSQFLISQEQ